MSAVEFLDNFLNLILGVIIIAAALTGLALLSLAAYWFFILWHRFVTREKRALDYITLQVAVLRDNEVKIDAAEQLFSQLVSLKKSAGLVKFWKWSFFKAASLQPHISFEIVARPEDIRFYISLPKKLQDLIEKLIHGAYPNADIRLVDEYNLFTAEGEVAFAQFGLSKAPFYPLQTYKNLPTDPLSALTSSLAKMGPGEAAALHFLIWPADSGWKDPGRAKIKKVKKEARDPEGSGSSINPQEIEAIENKLSQPGFNAVVRIVVCAKDQTAAKLHLDNLGSTLEQFSSDQNSFKKQNPRLKKLFMREFIYRMQPLITRNLKPAVLVPEEIASLYHFPNKAIETPHIFWLNSRRAPAPQNIPKKGLYIGKSVYRGITRPVHLQTVDRQRHFYIIGKTGTGKSEMLKDLILQDIKAGHGVALIDPSDTIEKLLELIPPERAEDVIYFDPSNLERPIGLNMLEAQTEDQKHFVVAAMIGLMYKLYDPHQTGIVGPRFEHAVRNVMLTVMSEPGATFIEVVRALTDSKYVQELLPKVQDPLIRRYWTDQIAQTADFHKSEVLDYIVSKYGRFVTNRMVRNIIGQSKSSFNLREVMDQGKILLVNLAKGTIGEENSNFLGLILVPRILIAAMSRQDIPEDQRRDFYLYVDEFQNFATPDFATILSEARKYRLNLTVANQFIGQMEEDVKNAVFGNVGTLAAFRVGVADAGYLKHEFQPVFSEADLLNIDRYNIFMKTIVDGEPAPPFSVDLTKDIAAEKRARNPKVAAMIKELSNLKYGRPRQIVEQEIAQRARL